MEIMVQENDQGYIKRDNIDGPLAGRRLRRREIKADMRGYAAELLAKTRHGTLQVGKLPIESELHLRDELGGRGPERTEDP